MNTVNKQKSFGADPEFHRFRMLMGQAISLQQQGQYADAERVYNQILAANPQQADALHFLGLLRHQSGRHAEALELMTKSLELGLPNAGYLYNVGGVLQQQGRWLDATQYLQQAVDLMPSHAGAWNRMGECFEDMNMQFKATECYRNALRHDQQSPVFALNLARTLHGTGEFQEALEVIRACREKHPEDQDLLLMEVNTLDATGQLDTAVERLQGALRSDPLSARLHQMLGTLLAERGDFKQAESQFTQAVGIDPQFYAAYHSLASIQKHAKGDPRVDDLEQKLERNPPQNPQPRIAAEFCLGKMRDDQEEYEKAFIHYQRGNSLARGLHKYSTSAMTMYVNGLIEHLGADFVAARAGSGSDSEKPVFIIGMMRSGSSLVEQILAAHPAVTAGGEMAFLSQSLRKYTENPGIVSGDKIAALSDGQLREMGERYLTQVARYTADTARVTDKLPGNFLIVGLIRALFPKARIIHCRRDPLDTCVSCYFTHFDAGQPYAYDMTELGEYYQLYRRMMDSHRTIVDDRSMLTVDYEDLVQDIEAGSRKIVEFCGLDWDPACLSFDKVQRPVSTASLYQVRQPVYQRSVGRWRHYAAHIEPLRNALAGLVD